VVSDTVSGFVGASVFCPGDFDGDINPFFGVLEGSITGSFGYMNIGYTIICRINKIKVNQLTLPIG
jgi:hypothetical protein